MTTTTANNDRRDDNARDEGDRGDHHAERRGAGQHGQQRAHGQNDRGDQVALLLADPGADRGPGRGEQERRADAAPGSRGWRSGTSTGRACGATPTGAWTTTTSRSRNCGSAGTGTTTWRGVVGGST
jgi:hypothetical protein